MPYRLKEDGREYTFTTLRKVADEIDDTILYKIDAEKQPAVCRFTVWEIDSDGTALRYFSGAASATDNLAYVSWTPDDRRVKERMRRLKKYLFHA